MFLTAPRKVGKYLFGMDASGNNRIIKKGKRKIWNYKTLCIVIQHSWALIQNTLDAHFPVKIRISVKGVTSILPLSEYNEFIVGDK